MTAWLLTLVMYTGTGVGVSSTIVADRDSCIRAGTTFVKAYEVSYSIPHNQNTTTYYTCTGVKK